MTDADKKLLTEFLGECWHEGWVNKAGTYCCNKCPAAYPSVEASRLDFTDWRVVGRLYYKLLLTMKTPLRVTSFAHDIAYTASVGELRLMARIWRKCSSQ